MNSSVFRFVYDTLPVGKAWDGMNEPQEVLDVVAMGTYRYGVYTKC